MADKTRTAFRRCLNPADPDGRRCLRAIIAAAGLAAPLDLARAPAGLPPEHALSYAAGARDLALAILDQAGVRLFQDLSLLGDDP